MKMLKLLTCALFAVLTHAALPPETYSGVCPALTYDHVVEGASVYFIPDTPQNQQFKFVDLHIQGPGPVVNYSMKRATYNGRLAYSLAVTDGPIAAAMLSPSAPSVSYSFTYCVPVNGKPVDCDSATHLFERVEWEADPFPACPTQCGMPFSTVSREVRCVLVKSGEIRPGWKCNELTKPSTTQNCYETEPCERYSWREGQVECPTDCGLPASTLPVPVECVGDQGSIGNDYECGNRPAPVRCPATPPCVTYDWKVINYATCPEECGLVAQTLYHEYVCMGSDGLTYSNDKCNEYVRPRPISCPRTRPCETFSWRAGQVECPTACGVPESTIPVPAECVGSEGSMADGTECGQAPEPIVCPATAPCAKPHYATIHRVVTQHKHHKPHKHHFKPHGHKLHKFPSKPLFRLGPHGHHKAPLISTHSSSSSSSWSGL